MMIVVSLLTKHSDSETALPSLRQTYRENPGLGRTGLMGWSALAVVMVVLYVFFQVVM